jgi:alanine racemase
MARPIRARIDLAAFRHNLQHARKVAAPAKTWVVVKADAYGHGMLRSALAVADIADGYALLELDEAVRLRQAGIRQPILLLEGFFHADEIETIAAYQLTPVIHCREQAEALLATAQRPPLAIKINSGMNRLGFSAAELPWLRERLAELGRGGVTMMTHFAEADRFGGVAAQLAQFRRLLPDWQGPVSLANSAALLRHPETIGDWVRPGIMLYGSSPFADLSAAAIGLRPVMTLSSEIIAVQELAAGDRVGYGGSYVAGTRMRIGIVACGYADGYPRHAPSGTPVLVDGQRTATVGRVSMDMLAVDLGALPQALPGTAVTLWGEGLAADEVAASAGTISYELFCALAPRVPKLEVS